MHINVWLVIAGIMMVAGCGNQEELEQRNNELSRELASKDRFIEEITTTVNEIHTSLENAWAMERGVVQQAATAEGSKAITPVELKYRILDRIVDMRTSLSKNQQKVANLQKRLRNSRIQYAGLEKMVADLKTRLDEREQSIAGLSERVRNLESDVVKKTQIISAHEIAITEQEDVIAEQKKKLNTVYYVAGNRDELQERGVIKDEGGILWGLTGTTTVLAPVNHDGQFETFDKTAEKVIPVRGMIDEMIPKREPSSYVVERAQNGTTVLIIVKPEEFWRKKQEEFIYQIRLKALSEKK